MADKLSIKTAVDWKTVGKWTAGGALAAMPVAAIIKLMNEIKNEREIRKTQYGPSETDENTIVLTLPRAVAPKVAAILGYKQAETDPMTFALRTIGMGAGAVGGYALIDMLYKRYARKQLADEEAKAKNDMLKVMMTPKHAEFVKEAQLNTAVGAALLLTLLGTGGTAYLTKKILDERSEAVSGNDIPMPKVKRIVFKGQGPARTKEELKAANANDIELMKFSADIEYLQAATYMMMDLLRGGPTRVLDDLSVKTAFDSKHLETLRTVAREAKSAEEVLTKLSHSAKPANDYFMDQLRDPEQRTIVIGAITKRSQTTATTPDSPGPMHDYAMRAINTPAKINAKLVADRAKYVNDPASVTSKLDEYSKEHPVLGGMAKFVHGVAPKLSTGIAYDAATAANTLAPDKFRDTVARPAAEKEYQNSGWSKFDSVVGPIWQKLKPYWNDIKKWGTPIFNNLLSAFSGPPAARGLSNTNYGQDMVKAQSVKAGEYNARILGALTNAVIISKAVSSAQEAQAQKSERAQQRLTPKQVKDKVHTVQVAAADPVANDYLLKNRQKLLATLKQLAEEDKI